jgi:hypothetical protein
LISFNRDFLTEVYTVAQDNPPTHPATQSTSGPLINFNRDFLTEVYTVEKTVEVWISADEGPAFPLRIEAIRNERTGKYKTRAYTLRDVDVSLSPGDSKKSPAKAWVEVYTPHTSRDTMDDAINQLIGFLPERFKIPTKNARPARPHAGAA